jgi:hypothetical protein
VRAKRIGRARARIERGSGSKKDRERERARKRSRARERESIKVIASTRSTTHNDMAHNTKLDVRD